MAEKERDYCIQCGFTPVSAEGLTCCGCLCANAIMKRAKALRASSPQEGNEG